jgi:hypothetical protein
VYLMNSRHNDAKSDKTCSKCQCRAVLHGLDGNQCSDVS